MCSFQELFHGKRSYIIRCKECNHYQLLFESIVLSMNETEFASFKETVELFKKDLIRCDNDSMLPMRTTRQGIHLLMNKKKIEELIATLDAADTEIKTMNLLQLFAG